MSARDLFENPLWRHDDFGKRMPDDMHALSAAIPTWSQLVAFESGAEKIVRGYPRFVYHATYLELCARCGDAPPDDEAVRVLPSERAAKACKAFNDGEGEIIETPEGLYAVRLGRFLEGGIKMFWQHTGLVVSSRQSEDIVVSRAPPDGTAAKDEIKTRIADLAGVNVGDVYLFPSGMAAMFNAHGLATARTPDARTVQLGFPYLDTLKVQDKFGGAKEFAYRSPEDLVALDEFLAAKPIAAVFCEAPGNPLLRSVDFPALKEILDRHHVPLVVDDTIGTWENVDIRPYADVTFTSLSKFFSGEGNVMAGSLVLNPASAYYAELSQRMHETYEDIFYAGDAIELATNSHSFSERMNLINANALGVAEFLRKHPAVKTVYFPDEINRDAYEKIRRPVGGFGGLFTIELKDPARAPEFYDALEFCKGPGLGTNFTLVSPYTMLAHFQELSRVEKFGVLPHQLRVSVGLEDQGVIMDRFYRALGLAA
jgi:cystathionine gamma-synthase